MKLFSKKQIETGEEEKLGTPAVDGEGQQETDKTQEVMAYIRKRNPRRKKKFIRIAIAAVLLAAILGGVVHAKTKGNSQGVQLATVAVERGDVEQNIRRQEPWKVRTYRHISQMWRLRFPK